jgi:hypothetical protein
LGSNYGGKMSEILKQKHSERRKLDFLKKKRKQQLKTIIAKKEKDKPVKRPDDEILEDDLAEYYKIK